MIFKVSLGVFRVINITMLTLEKDEKMKNTNEAGRSMVEMLGVLAIIGVLSF